MTGRNRNQRLSDPQRNALWMLYRGGYVVEMPEDVSRGAWFVGKQSKGPAIRRSVVLALIARGLLTQTHAEWNRLFGLTLHGIEVAREVAHQIDPRPNERSA